MLPIENDHLPGETPSAASADARRQRDVHAAKLRAAGVQGEGNYDAARNFNSAERAGKRHAKKDPEARNAARKTGTLTLDKRG